MRTSEAQVHQKDAKILGLEMEMKHANQKEKMLEDEKKDLKKELADLKSEVMTLNTDNTLLQNELHEKKSSVSDHRGSKCIHLSLCFCDKTNLQHLELLFF